MESVKVITKKWSNVMDIISMSMGLGVNWTIISVIAVLLQPYGYTQIQIGVVGLWFCLTGTLAGLFATLYLDWQIQRH
jgi:FLVCR family feline leukemia virus subgroup C receptor-related protein